VGQDGILPHSIFHESTTNLSGGDAKQWIELFPNIADAGSGVLDLPAILQQARQSGVAHFFVERDRAPNAEETLRKSHDYLAALRAK
jgi:sugar phosphate isomerase/epimerase